MKPLFILLSFAAIVAFGVTCVASMLQGFIEGHITAKAEAEIDKSKEYSDASLVLDHFHAKNVTVVAKQPVDSENLDRAKEEIRELIEPVLGVYAQDCEVTFKNAAPVLDPNPKENPAEAIAQTPKPGPPPPSETQDLTIEKEPARFSILWNSKEKSLLLKGKQTNKHAEVELRKYFKQARKEAKFRSEIEIDIETVANSQYLMRSLREVKLLIKNSEDDLRVEFQDALKTKDGQKIGFLKIVGTTGNLGLYDALTAGFKTLENDDFEVQNQLVFYPYVSIKKDATQEKIILTGCVRDKIEQSMLGSNAGRDVASNYSTDNQLVDHERCLEIAWHDEYAVTLIAEHMNKVAEGEIVYRNNKLFALSGISHDKEYVDEVRDAFRDTEIASKLYYEDPPRKQIKLVEPEPVRPESLAEQLADYKIYFESGKFKVDPRYSAQLDEMTKKINDSADKESQLIVGGYADASGYAAQNKVLSLKRAKAVMTLLISKGVDANRLQVEFLGIESDGKTKEESRRVEIKVRKR